MKKLLWAALILFCVLVVAALWQFRGARTMNDPQTLASLVSDEIIYDDDGLVDFVAMLNTRLSRDIRPADNAFIDYARILGPLRFTTEEWSEQCKWLQVDSIRCDDPFVALNEFEVKTQQNVEREAWMRPWTDSDFPHCATWLKQNTHFVEAIREASNRPQFYCPLVALPDSNVKQARTISILLEHQQAIRELSRFMMVHAIHALATGDVATAIADLETRHRMAAQTAHGYFAVEKLIGSAIDGEAFQTASQLLAFGQATTEQLARYRRFLKDHPWDCQMIDAVAVGERFAILDIVQSCEKWGLSGAIPATNTDQDIAEAHGSLLRYLLNWSTAAREVSSNVDSIVETWNQPDDLVRLQHLQLLETSLQKRAIDNVHGIARLVAGGANFRGKVYGQILSQIFLSSLETLAAAEIRNRMRREMIDFGLAIAEYRLENGELPKSLNLLVPKTNGRAVGPPSFGGRIIPGLRRLGLG